MTIENKQILKYQRQIIKTDDSYTHKIPCFSKTYEFKHQSILSKDDEFNDIFTTCSNYLLDSEHSIRVSVLIEKFSELLNLPNNLCLDFKKFSLIHDVGKLLINPDILNKPGKLSEEEYEIVKKHSELGAEIIGDDPFFKTGKDISLYHHERYDGQGYPRKINGNSIPISARILSIIDVYDGLTSDRVYRKALPLSESINIMKEMTGKFDPIFFKIFLTNIQNLIE